MRTIKGRKIKIAYKVFGIRRIFGHYDRDLVDLGLQTNTAFGDWEQIYRLPTKSVGQGENGVDGVIFVV